MIYSKELRNAVAEAYNETSEQREPIWYAPEPLEWGDSEFDFDPDQGAK